MSNLLIKDFPNEILATAKSTAALKQKTLREWVIERLDTGGSNGSHQVAQRAEAEKTAKRSASIGKEIEVACEEKQEFCMKQVGMTVGKFCHHKPGHKGKCE